jgi:hypothetical protein
MVNTLLEDCLLLTTPGQRIVSSLKKDCLYEHILPFTLRSKEMVIKIKKVLQEKVIGVAVLTYFF